MICYKDRTYCSFYNECMEGKTCSRAANDHIQNMALSIGLPLCLYLDKQKCFRDNNIKEKE